MATKKVVFVAFAIEDEGQRNLLKGQSLNTQSPFEYVDMSVAAPTPTLQTPSRRCLMWRRRRRRRCVRPLRRV